MLLAILFSLAQAKRICVCNNECSTFCPADRYVAPNSVSQFEDFISNIKNENEIEINFYSKQDGFNFEIDSTYFGDKKITLKTLKDSKPVNLKIKEKSQQFHKSIEIKPNFQIELPDLIPIKQNLINERKSLLSDPYPTPVPISIAIFQMEIIGSFSCTPGYPDTTDKAKKSGCENHLDNLDSIAAYQCGYRCWSSSAYYSYTFKGVKFQLYGTNDPHHGKFDIELDGVIITEIDQNKTPRAEYQVLYTSELLEYKEHTVKTIPKAETYEIYKLAFWPSMKARRLNSTDFTKINGTWKKETDGIGGVREYTEVGGSVSAQIKCSKYWFYGLRDSNLGYITMTYGGVSEQVNQYSITRLESSLIYESKGLPYTTETLTISIPSGSLMVYCLYYEDPEVQTEIPQPTQTINPNMPTPEATPVATPIPISVGLYQMNPNGFSTADCDNKDIHDANLIQNLGCGINVLDHSSAYQCGFRCWGKGSYSYSFTGVKFLIYGTYDNAHGDFSITIDNGNPIKVNEKKTTRQTHAVVYESEILSYGKHTVNINPLNGIYELYKLVYYPDMNAKRLNSTQMSKGLNWKKESDGIGGTREYTNNPGATATAIIPCSKFWIYGTTAGHHTSMDLILDDDEDHPIPVNEYTTNREDGALLYTSNELPYGNHKINLIAKGVVLINFIYYLDNPPTQTPDPYPSRTPVVQTANDFINKEFVNTIPNYQINIHPSSIISEIRGCRFKTISENFDYFIILYKQIKISDNIFEYEANQIDAPAPFDIRYNSPVKIERCKFINSRSRSNKGNVLYCSNDYAVTAEFESCEFTNCGKSASEMIIKIESSFSTLNLNNCTFSFDDSYKSSKITDITCANFHIANCKFNKCGAINAKLTSTKSIFEYINNIASSITQQFLYITDIQAKPTISGNVFQDCQIANRYFLNFLHDQDEIILENNTFSSITASSDDGVKLYGGAISLWIQKKGYTQGSIIFDQCKFYDNQNQHPEGIFAQGGAFQLGYTSSVANVSVEFNDCDFKRNKCLNGKGGALGIDVAHNITLSNCIFEENTASQEGGAIYIWGKVVKPEEQQAPNLPSSIKIESINIIDCTFERNKASRGAAIFTEIDNVEIDLLSISFSNFTDNFGDSNDKQMMIQSSNDKFVFENNSVEYTQVKTAGVMELTLNTSAELTYSTFINCKVSDYQTINILPYSTFTPSFTMNNCDFNDCITNSYIIHLQNKGDDTIKDCSFIFSNNENACAGIDIDSPNQVTIENCKFENNKNNNQGETGCLYIHRETDSISNINLNNILFDSCTGSTYSTIYVNGHCTSLAVVKGLNIKNTKNSQEKIFIFGFNTQTNLEFDACTFENCSSNNEFGGGIGSKLLPQKEIKFRNCNWINNYNSQNGGAFQYGKETEFNDKIIEFESCTFTGNKSPKFGGALALQTHNKITIDECQFLGNKAGLKAGSNLLEEEEGLGGAVYINPGITQSLIEKPEYIIKDNTFIDNEANNAHALYITNSQNMIVNLKSENVFTDNGDTGSTIVTDQKIDISESIFNSTTGSNDQVSNPIEYDKLPAEYMDLTFSQQLVVKENQKVANFHNCTFDNCKFDQNDPQHQYVLTIHCDMFIFDNCTIKFNRADIACGAICIDRYCNASITDSYFARCNVKDNSQSGGIYYQPIEGQGYKNIENMIFTSNTFDEMSGINARCFKITIDYEKLNKIRDITIKNCPVFGYTGAFYFITTSSLSDTIEFIDWKFIRNSCNSLLSGGSGLWISPKNSGTNFHLVFRNCLWDANRAIYDESVNTTGQNGPRPDLHNGCGGAFQFGFTESNANLQLTFDDCEFKANIAEKEGGALAIQTTKSCRITNCIFTNNEASGSNGGAIFIDPDFRNNYVTDSRNPQIEISFSEFTGNNAFDGSALYITGQSATYNLAEITFTNNEGSNNVFYSSANSLDFRTSKFQSGNNLNNRAIEIIAKTRMVLQNISFTDFSSNSNLSGRAIRLRGQDNTYSTLLADATYEIYFCTFRNIVTSGKGGAVYVDFISKLELRSSIFDNCKGDGAVAYVDENVNDFSMHFNQILNMNDEDHNVIVCKSPNFDINDQDFSNIGNIKGPSFDSGTLNLDGVTFEGLRTGIEVSEKITDAVIKNCNFINCKSGKNDFIIKIKNNKCTFQNNTIICTNQSISSRAISITGYGDIEVTHNRIINCSSGENGLASIYIYPQSRGEQNILFNYNYMKGLSNCKLAIFDISYEYENVNFDHNLISECINKKGLQNNDGYLSQFNKIYSDLTIKNLTFEDCMSTAAYGGSFGCWFSSNKAGTTISFINCHFLNNDHDQTKTKTGGIIQMGGSSNAYFKIVIDGCTFSGNTAKHDGGALSFAHNETVTISNCVFDNNRVRDGNGGAIFLNNENIKETVTIENCIFENNFDANGNGNAIYIQNSKTQGTNLVEITSNCVFKNNFGPLTNDRISNYAIYTSTPSFSLRDAIISSNNIDNMVSGINFNGTNSFNSVINVTFEKCNNNKAARALAIDIHKETKSVEILSCQFISCGRINTNFDKYTIYDEGQNTKIDDCTFKGGPTNNDPRAPAIKVKSFGVHSITNIIIEYPVCTNKGAISYLDNDNSNVGESEKEDFTLDQITIKAAKGNDRAALNLIIFKNSAYINNITIRECTGDCFFGLELQNGGDSDFTFNEFHFLNNSCSGTYGGGSGMWIDKGNTNNVQIVFNNCTFRNNNAIYGDVNHQAYGGALQLGDIKGQSERYQYTITNCIFENNYAGKYGGAITIGVENSFTVEGCQFINNRADIYGGAIYVDPGFDTNGKKTALITDCIFNNNSATNAGASIYIKENKKRTNANNQEISITGNCQFQMSYKSSLSIIHAKCSKLKISDISFDMESLYKTCRAIYLAYPAYNPEINNVIFRNCDAGGEGNAIYSEPLHNDIRSYERIRLTIISCRFENCGTIGWAVYVNDPALYFRNNIITYSSNTKNSGGGGLYSGDGGIIERNTIENTFKYNQIGNPLTLSFEYDFGKAMYYQFYFRHNIFINCNGEADQRCFEIKLSKISSNQVDFENITIQNCPESQGLIGSMNIENSFSVGVILSRWKYINNKVLINSEGYAGINIRAPNGYPIEIYGCTFENNTNRDGNGGAFQITYTNSNAYKCIIQGSTFRNNEALNGGAISITTTNRWEIYDNCIFDNNKATASKSQNGGGGAIFVNTKIADQITNPSIIQSSTFINNYASSEEGTIIKITESLNEGGESITISNINNGIINMNEPGSIISNGYNQLIITGIRFSFGGTGNSEFRVLHAFNNGKTQLNHCKFNEIAMTTDIPKGRDLGTVIRLDGLHHLIINNCEFIDCTAKNQNCNNFVIYGSTECGKTLEVYDSLFYFTSSDRSASGICIERYCKLYIDNCNFTNCHNNRPDQYAGGIRYGRAPSSEKGHSNNNDGKEEDHREYCDVRITRCTFQNCNNKNNQKNGGRVIQGYAARASIFRNCTIRDTVDGGYIFVWGHESDARSQFVLDEFRFVNNQANCEAGGAGIWISQAENLTFRSCYFINNKQTNATLNGGAYAVVTSTSVTQQDILFDNCYFEDNSVPNGGNNDYNLGGALYLRAPSHKVTVKDCTFVDTRNIGAEGVARLGGAIYVDSDNEAGIIITGCTFTHTQSLADGNAICIAEGGNLVTINHCTFTDCHHNQRFSVIWNYGLNSMEFIDSTITFTNSAQSSRGIIVFKRSNIKIRGSSFHNCVYGEHGCGFAYNPGKKAELYNNEHLSIEDTIFDACSSVTSEAERQSTVYIYTTQSFEFNQVTISNSAPTQNRNIIILEGPNGQVLEEQILKDCNFINCTTNYEQNHAGGIGLKHGNIRHLIFDSCNFNGLRSNGFGGAVAIDDMKNNVKDCSVEFRNCKFENNSATGNSGQGASLYFNVPYEIYVKDCNFTSQTLSGSGGAIYGQHTSNLLIENTGFYSTQETNEGKGNAIYLARGFPTCTITGNCRFYDCGIKGSVIESEAIEFIFYQSTIQFTSNDNAARALNFPCQCVLKIANSTITTCKSDSEGAGIKYDGVVSSQQEFIQIENTIFDNNNANNGCAVFLKIRSLPNITGCTIRNHQSGKYIFVIIYLTVILDEVSIKDCVFENNYYSKETDGGGSGIWIAAQQYLYDSAYPIGINSCIFRNNRAKNGGGAFAYGHSGTLNNIMVNLRDCQFIGNVAEGNGGAIYLETQTECVIDGCVFTNNYVSNNANNGHAIYVNTNGKVYITDTTFIDCTSKGGIGSVITFAGTKICMEDSTVQFTQENNGSRGIEITVATDVELARDTFFRCHSSGDGGGLYLHVTTTNNEGYKLKFEDLIFDNNTAGNGCAALIDTSVIPDISGCTFRNHQSGKYVFCIFFNTIQTSFDLRTCIFENNAHNSQGSTIDGGGSGIWIANKKEIAQQRSLQLYLTECQFRDNLSPHTGGAFAIGQSDTVKATDLLIDTCTFTSNTAQSIGGALWIATRSNIEIRNCAFRNNNAVQTAGSIVIASTAPSCVINKCTFNRENANNLANAIYINSLTTETFLTENTFTDCGFSSDSSEIIAINSNYFEYVENTITFTTLLNSCRGLTIQSTGTQIIKDSKFSMCNITSGNKFGGGIYYVCSDASASNEDTVEDILIDGCTFDYCHADSGSALYLNTKSIPEMKNNVIQNSKTGQYTLTLMFKKASITEFTLEEFTFYNNKASPKTITANTKYDGGGSGIYITNPSSSSTQFNLTFHKCNWTLNSSPYKGGALAYGDSQELKHTNLIFDDCIFVRNNCKKDIAGCLWLSSESDATLTINKCTFTSNKALTNTSIGGCVYLDTTYKGRAIITESTFSKNSAIDANALYIEQSAQSVSIENCNIESNGNTGSQIINFCEELNIIDSQVGFGAYTLSARSICCLARCRLTILRSTIGNCKTNDVTGCKSIDGIHKNWGGGILYTAKRTTNNEEQIIIEDTTFDNCRADNGAAILLEPIKAVVFNKNTIQECRGGNFMFCIFHQEYVEQFVFEELTFRRNKFTKNDEDGGGSGMWVNNIAEKLPINTPSILKFINCYWIENENTNAGGAVAYGKSSTLKVTALTFDKCHFTSNIAGTHGGALYIQVNKPVLIKECTFKSNSATGSNNYGGSISIDSESTSINIVGCTFESESAKDGSAVSLGPRTNNINITGCSFNDCGGTQINSVVLVRSKGATIDDCTVQFKSRLKSSRAINISSKCNTIIRDTNFINCRTSGYGAGILLEKTDLTENEENLQIEGCLFDRCEGSNGQAIFAKLSTPIILKSNLFWYHSTKYIISVMYSDDITETFIEDCYFEHNSLFSQDPIQGGGSGFWISRDDKQAQNVIFNACTWRNNSCQNNGGAFAIASGNYNTLALEGLEFNDCIFINNTARGNGGALYINHKAKLDVRNCFFDGNQAGNQHYGGAIYIDKPVSGNVLIEDCRFARNTAYDAGAVHCRTPDSVSINSCIFRENTVSQYTPNLYLIIDQINGKEDQAVSNCKFDFNKSPGEYQVFIGMTKLPEGGDGGASVLPDIKVIFVGNCFTHSGEGESIAHIKSDYTGQIILGEGNCFDLQKEYSIETPVESNLIVSNGLFDCHTCQVPTVPTSPPTNMPSATPAATPEATTPPPTPTNPPSDYVYPTQSSVPTSRPTSHSSVPQTSGIEPTSIVTTSNNGGSSNSGSSSKSQSKKIILIAGIAVAAVVIIVVIIILVWLFVCRNKVSRQQEERTRNTEMNEETISGITGVNDTNQTDDPIWAGTSGTQDNLLFEGNENGEADEPANNDFEESWGAM